MSLVRRSVTEDTFGLEYGMTVMVFETLAVYPRESVTVSVTVTLPDLAIFPTVIAAPVELDADQPLQEAV